jgi:hypothetical protein
LLSYNPLMDPISKINRNLPINSENQIAPEQQSSLNESAQNTESPDSLEAGQLDTFRAAYLSGRSEGKVLMSEASFNHVLRNEMKPQQYPEAFSDLKNWVRSNFALTGDQEQTLNLLGDEQIRRVQDAGKRAADLNLPLTFEVDDPDPSAPGPRDLKFREPVVLPDSVVIRQECQRFEKIAEQLPETALPE